MHCILLIFFLICCNHLLNYNFANGITINGEFNVPYNFNITNNLSFTFDYEYFRETLENKTIRIFLSSSYSTPSFPLFCIIRNGNYILTLQLPLKTSQNNYYHSVSRTLCSDFINKNHSQEKIRDTTSLPKDLISSVIHHSDQSSINLELFTEVPYQIQFTLLLSMENQYVLSQGKGITFTVSPSQPLFFFYRFPINSSSVRIVATSNDKFCSVMSVQSIPCPVFDLDENVRFEGIYQTMTTKSAFTLSKTNYPYEAFFVVFIVKVEDDECIGTGKRKTPSHFHPNYHLLGSNETMRIKTINLQLLPSLTRFEYIEAILVPLAVFILLYALTFALLFGWYVRDKRREFADWLVTEHGDVGNDSSTNLRTPLLISSHNDINKNNKNNNTHGLSTRKNAVKNYNTLNRKNGLGLNSCAVVDPRQKNIHNICKQINVTGSGKYNDRLLLTNSSADDEDDDDEDTNPSLAALSSDSSCSSSSTISEKSRRLTKPKQQPQHCISSIPLNNDVTIYGPTKPPDSTETWPFSPARMRSLEPNNSSASAASPTSQFYVPGFLGENNSRHRFSIHNKYLEKINQNKANLAVADLARKKTKMLHKKYLLFHWNLFPIAIFYILPVVQLVFTYEKIINLTGNQDFCYFNLMCANPFGDLPSFNNIYSNIGYILLGILFFILVWRRDVIHEKCAILNGSLDNYYGIPNHFGLFYAMAFSLCFEGILSSCYHVCPNYSNYQFDTSFMYIITCLTMLKIYQTRHPDRSASSYYSYFAFAVVVVISVIGVLNGNDYFWILFSIGHIATCTYLSLQIYYIGYWKLDRNIFHRTYQFWLEEIPNNPYPKFPDRLLLLVLANLANLGLCVYGLYTRPKNFPSYLLSILILNLLLYLAFYIIMKLRSGERILLYPFIFIICSMVCWAFACYFFLHGNISWQISPAQSREKNRDCILFKFYDAHDIWHFFSALALFCSYTTLLTLDDDLINVRRDKIPVF